MILRLNLLRRIGDSGMSSISDITTGEKVFERVPVFVIVVGIVPLIVLAGIHFGKKRDLAAYYEKVAILEERRKNVEGELKPLEQYDTSLQELKNKENKLNFQQSLLSSLETEHRYLPILSRISAVIPENVWLVEINARDKNIEIQGRGEDYLAVTNFVNKLEETGLFEEVKIDPSPSVEQQKGQLVIFKLKAMKKIGENVHPVASEMEP